MKPNFETDVVHEGTLGGKRVAFSIDVSNAASLAHIMTELTDLYSDLMGAAIREPSTNAQDSHIAAGQTRPIEVSLPTDLDPCFTIRDWGVGLTEEELLENYSKYGWSSKRDNDDEAGMLGFGCKAPLTYTSQFTVRAIKDGVVVDVLVSRGEDGVGGLEPVSRRKTKEPNGVEVIIPVMDQREEFVSKALHFFGFWAPGSVLVDGKEPPKHMEHENARVLDPDVILTNEVRQDYVVMGNVPYPVGRAITDYNREGCAIVRVPVGMVDPAPSREALKMTPRSRDCLRAASAFVHESLRRVAQADVDETSSPTEAIDRRQKWIYIDREVGESLTYRGKPVPSAIKLPSEGFSYRSSWETSAKLTQHSTVNTSRLREVGWLVGYTLKTFTVVHKAKVDKYLEENNLDKNATIFVVESIPNMFWVDDPLFVIHWDDIRKMKPPPDPNAKPKVKKPVGWEVVNKNGHVETIYDPKFEGKVIVASGQGMYADAREARRAFPDDTILLLHPNRVEKFFREHKGAISLEDAALKEATRLPRRITASEVEALRLDGDFRFIFRHVEAKDVRDPKVAGLLATVAEVEEKRLAARLSALDSLLPYYRRHLVKLSGKRKVSSYIKKKYPLLENLNRYGIHDPGPIIEYINVMYSARSTRQENAA